MRVSVDVEILGKLLISNTILLTQDGLLHHRALRQGVKGLQASEGYGLDLSTSPDPAQCLVFALCEVFRLHLESLNHDFFVIPPDVFDLAQQMVMPSRSHAPLSYPLRKIILNHNQYGCTREMRRSLPEQFVFPDDTQPEII